MSLAAYPSETNKRKKMHITAFWDTQMEDW